MQLSMRRGESGSRQGIAVVEDSQSQANPCKMRGDLLSVIRLRTVLGAVFLASHQSAPSELGVNLKSG